MLVPLAPFGTINWTPLGVSCIAFLAGRSQVKTCLFASQPDPLLLRSPSSPTLPGSSLSLEGEDFPCLAASRLSLLEVQSVAVSGHSQDRRKRMDHSPSRRNRDVRSQGGRR